MGQQQMPRTFANFAWILMVLAFLFGCEERRPAQTNTSEAASATQPARGHTIASLVPAATDLLLAMGAGEHLVGVSNFDVDREGTTGLPRVGDYQTINWEALAGLRPAYLIHQAKPDRLPPGLVERARTLDIELLNIQIERIDDILIAAARLGKAVGEPEKARALNDTLQAQLDATSASVAGRPRIRTLIVRDETGLAVIGRDTFCDDALTIAGGENVIAAGTHRYPNIDLEMLLALKPDVIFQLLPDAPPQVLTEARRVWTTVPGLPAVQNKRVYIMTDRFVLLPGSHVGDVAAMFAEKLHGIPRSTGALP